jgi:hypothetical protein
MNPTGKQVGGRNLTQPDRRFPASTTFSKHLANSSSLVLPERNVFTRLEIYKTEKNLRAPCAWRIDNCACKLSR